MPTISELVVKITADAKGFTAGLTDSQKKMVAFGASATAITAAAVAVGKAIYKASQEFANYGSAIYDAAQKTGMSTDAIQEWKYIAEQSGASIESVTTAFGYMTRAMAANEEQFQSLGVTVRNSDGTMRSANDVFNDTVRVLSTMTNTTERDQLAFKLLGRGAQELIPILNSGATAIESMRDEAHAFGIVLDKETISKADELGDATDRLKSAFTAAKNNMVSELAPAITAITNFLAEQIQATVNAKRAWEELERAKKGEAQTEDELGLAIKAQQAEVDRLNKALAYRSQLDKETVALLEKQLADGQLLLSSLEKQRAAQARWAEADRRGTAEAKRLAEQAQIEADKAARAAEEAAQRQAERIAQEQEAIKATEARIAAEVRLREAISKGREELFEQMEEFDAKTIEQDKEVVDAKIANQKQLEKATKSAINLYSIGWQKAYDSVKAAAESLGQLLQARYEKEIKQIDIETQKKLKARGLESEDEISKLKKERDAAIAAGDSVTAAEKQAAIDREQIIAEGERKKAQIRYKADMAAWTSRLALATADAAGALIRAFTDLGPIGGAIAAAAIGTANAFQLAAIIAAKPQMQAFAMGTDFAPGGRALVGENGPEIINVPRGASVTPAHRTMTGGGDSGIVVNINSPVALNPSEAAAVMKQTMRELAYVGAL